MSFGNILNAGLGFLKGGSIASNIFGPATGQIAGGLQQGLAAGNLFNSNTAAAYSSAGSYAATAASGQAVNDAGLSGANQAADASRQATIQTQIVSVAQMMQKAAAAVCKIMVDFMKQVAQDAGR